MKKSMKIAYLLAGITILVGGIWLVIVPSGLAQEQVDEVEQFAEELKEMGDTLEELSELRTENIAVKEEYAEVLLERQEKILNENKSAEQESRLSHATFELFLIQSRLIAEELKLWQVQSMLELQDGLDSAELNRSIELYFTDLVEKQAQADSEVFDLADKYRQYITDPEIKSQFELYITDGLSLTAE